MKSIFSAAGLFAAAVTAYTPPSGSTPTYGSLLTPDLQHPITTGQTFTIQWTPLTPTDGVTVSLVLCNGPSTNCVPQSSAIVEGVPAAQASYSWNVPCDLPLGTQETATGYGMLIIVDGTGQYQYSTQFSVVAGSSCSNSGTTSSSSSSSTSTTSSVSTSISTLSGSTSVSISPADISSTGSWITWSGSVPATATTLSTTTSVSVASAKTTSSSAASVTVASSSTSARASVYTGAAAMPTAFVNVFAAVGAAGLAVFAL